MKKLRKKYVTRESRTNFIYKIIDGKIDKHKKINPRLHSWELETPKDIRAGAIRDLTKNFFSNIAKLKKGGLPRFDLKFRSKKKESGIEIPKTAINIRERYLSIYKSYMSEPILISNDDIPIIEHDCRLNYENGMWFLYVPVTNHVKDSERKLQDYCALDPGSRNFQTVYSERETINIEMNKKVRKKLKNKLRMFQSLRDNKIVSRSHYKTRTRKLRYRYDCLVNDIHWKLIRYLTTNYSTIFLSRFESQDLVRKNKNKTFRGDILSLKHYQFRTRLANKCKEIHCGAKLILCTEEYTSKTCSWCGWINHMLGSNKVFNCKTCGMRLDRDINGARNILIKCLHETLYS